MCHLHSLNFLLLFAYDTHFPTFVNVLHSKKKVYWLEMVKFLGCENSYGIFTILQECYTLYQVLFRQGLLFFFGDIFHQDRQNCPFIFFYFNSLKLTSESNILKQRNYTFR